MLVVQYRLGADLKLDHKFFSEDLRRSKGWAGKLQRIRVRNKRV